MSASKSFARVQTRDTACFAAVVAAILEILSSPAQADTYQVLGVTATELPRLGGPASVANDVNNKGLIVGWSENAAQVQRAFLIQSNGTIQDLGTPADATNSIANGVNFLGEVVGNYKLDGVRPFHWHSYTGLSALSRNLVPYRRYGSSYDTRAYAINDLGVIVGAASYAGSVFPDDTCHHHPPVYWQGSSSDPQILSCSNGTSSHKWATDVSNSGWITRSLLNDGVSFRHALSSGLSVQAPPVTGQTQGRVRLWGVNESGTVVGEYQYPTPNNQLRAYYWNGITAKGMDLGVFAGGALSKAHEVNDQDFVVGRADEGSGEDYSPARAFLWHQNFGLYKLPAPSSWQVTVPECVANAVSDLRTAADGSLSLQVVGYCYRVGKLVAVSWAVSIGLSPSPPIG